MISACTVLFFLFVVPSGNGQSFPGEERSENGGGFRSESRHPSESYLLPADPKIHERGTQRCFKIYSKRTRYLHIKIFSDCQYFSTHIPECIHIRFWGKEVITSYSFKPEYSCENILMF